MIDIRALILDAIPVSFWVGVFVGAVGVGVFGAAIAFILSFLKRHWKTVLIACAVVVAGAAVLSL